MIRRYSSRRENIDETFINSKLEGAASYDRIAGYFSVSLLEVAGEKLEKVSNTVRIVCNSDIDIKDYHGVKSALQAQRISWSKNDELHFNEKAKSRYEHLARLLLSKKLQIKVLPNQAFGLIHGKAGIITYENGSKICFMGSVNESYTAWKTNYEILWEDDSDEGIKWLQEEFDALWDSKFALELSDFVIQDIIRISKRQVIKLENWRETDDKPESPVIETPVYRQEYGLMPHQKYFIEKAFKFHKLKGARFVLGDQVGLGKTIQLATAAMLMALYGNKPVLIIVPKPLIYQWQTELKEKLAIPSAVWTGKGWYDEQGILHPSVSPADIKKCPRLMGIVSQGLITLNSDVVDHLLDVKYECVIVDEAHRARRRKIKPNKLDKKPEYNNLMKFIRQIALSTKSLLLATATPIQIHPIEGWDLLNTLSLNTYHVMGNKWSKWRTDPETTLDIVSGKEDINNLDHWEWIRNPFPESDESRYFRLLRKTCFQVDDSVSVIKGEFFDKITGVHKTNYNFIKKNFSREHNPFIRFIVRRTRDFLEDTIDPETGEPYMKPISVKLFGENEEEALQMPHYFSVAYENAEKFCHLLGQRIKGSGFFKTILLKRFGSSAVAGFKTIESMIRRDKELFEENDDLRENEISEFLNLTKEERLCLNTCLEAMRKNNDHDPKFRVVKEYLKDEHWINDGCIIFSQYYDTSYWFAQRLSEEVFDDQVIGFYVGGGRSGVFKNGKFERKDREEIKELVGKMEIKLLIGTDAASEGLNLQKLGTLINLDLPWNPTRLEQRKGRIQRIGQERDEVKILNLRYKDSIEDRVHDILSDRLKDIYDIFGQLPDVLEEVWINVAYGEIEKAKQIINEVLPSHPFDERYNKVKHIDWESCEKVLKTEDINEVLSAPWNNSKNA